MCKNDSDITVRGYQDNYIDGVTYRVWSAFKNETYAEHCLENLMLRKLEADEPVDEVLDEYSEMIERKNNESETISPDDSEIIGFVL